MNETSAIINLDIDLPEQKRNEIQEFVHNLSNETQFEYTILYMNLELDRRRKLRETAPDLNDGPIFSTPYLAPQSSSGGKLVSACTSVSGQEPTMVTQNVVPQSISTPVGAPCVPLMPPDSNEWRVPPHKQTNKQTPAPCVPAAFDQTKPNTMSVIKNTRDHVGENNDLIGSYGLDNNSLSNRETGKNDLFDISDDKNIKAQVKLAFQCTICGKSFPKSIKLHNHQQSHFGVKIKPFSCDLCDQSFTRKDNLNKHKKNVHSGGKIVNQEKFKCDSCPKSFTAQIYLKRHQMRSHTSAKFRCSNCQKEFKHKKNKKEHESRCSSLQQFQQSWRQCPSQGDYHLQGFPLNPGEDRPEPDYALRNTEDTLRNTVPIRSHPTDSDNFASTQWIYGSNQNSQFYNVGSGQIDSGQFYNADSGQIDSDQFYNANSGQIDSGQYYNKEVMVSGQYYNMDYCGEIMNSAPMKNNNTSDNSTSFVFIQN